MLFRSIICCVRGSVSSEFGVLAPLLALFGFVAIDFSYFLLQNHKMENALTQAGRYLAHSPNPESIQETAKRLALSGSLDGSAPVIVPKWNSDDIQITIKPVSNVSLSDGLSYRGGSSIYVAELHSSLDYEGLGFLNFILPNALQLSAVHQERLMMRHDR